ncbi:hypothetical protein [Thiocapsa bogorovii]|uniref:hypothetical protein n=1 Tax=Thiocapsa bogorovii TaxID=521689 RepID=UPI001E3EDCF3|nr:hypothetical protein [Thiocapsa bogorovii]UHD14740.1 hypothetical protein LT988_15775 [Thiocapsa bogorovii]
MFDVDRQPLQAAMPRRTLAPSGALALAAVAVRTLTPLFRRSLRARFATGFFVVCAVLRLRPCLVHCRRRGVFVTGGILASR